MSRDDYILLCHVNECSDRVDYNWSYFIQLDIMMTISTDIYLHFVSSIVNSDLFDIKLA